MRFLALSLTVLLILVGPARAASIIDRVKAAGTLSCGVLLEPEDYGKSDVHGALSDLGSDVCHAVAAAVLGESSKVLFWSLPDEAHGFSAVRDGKVDLLIGASPSSAMAIIYGLHFAPPVFFDSTGFIVNAKSGIGSFADLAGRQVCMIANTPAENVFISATARRAVTARPFPFEEEGEMNFGLVSGHCEAMVSSRSRLAVARVGFGATRDEFVFLPDHLSIDPVSPAVQDRDGQWAAVVDDVIGALVLAESGGVRPIQRFELEDDRGPGPASTRRPHARDRCEGHRSGLGDPGHHRRGQLRGNVRAGLRIRLAAEASARLECALEPGRPDGRSAAQIAVHELDGTDPAATGRCPSTILCLLQAGSRIRPGKADRVVAQPG